MEEVVFTSGASSRCVDVNITDDDAVEANETFTITVFAINGNVIVENDAVVVTITEDPTLPDGEATVGMCTAGAVCLPAPG